MRAWALAAMLLVGCRADTSLLVSIEAARSLSFGPNQDIDAIEIDAQPLGDLSPSSPTRGWSTCAPPA